MASTERVAMVVEDDALVARAIARRLRSTVRVEVSGRAGSALARVCQLGAALAALIVDVKLPDGCGLSVAEQARARAPSLPILVVTGAADARVADLAFALDAPLLIKPFAPQSLDRFIARVVYCQGCTTHDPAAHIDRYLERSAVDLTGREREILSFAMTGLERREIARSLGLAEGTVKTLISRLLHKTGERSLSGIALRIWTARSAQ